MTLPCANVDPIDGYMQTEFFGKYICGIRGGRNFLDVQRYDLESGENGCPPGMSPCSNMTSPENTVCYETDALEDKCPITDM